MRRDLFLDGLIFIFYFFIFYRISFLSGSTFSADTFVVCIPPPPPPPVCNCIHQQHLRAHFKNAKHWQPYKLTGHRKTLHTFFLSFQSFAKVILDCLYDYQVATCVIKLHQNNSKPISKKVKSYVNNIIHLLTFSETKTVALSAYSQEFCPLLF